MLIDKNLRRLPLRDQLADAEKRAHDLIDQVNNHWLARAEDLRDLSRPVRKKSHFPTLLALAHAIEKLVQTSQEIDELVAQLTHELDEIHEQARLERLNRP